MIHNLAYTISILLHPILMPFYAVIILFNTQTPYNSIPFDIQLLSYANIILYTFVIPLLILYISIRLRYIQNIKIESCKERIYILFPCIISYYFAYKNAFHLTFYNTIPQYLLATLVLLAITALISFKWKISLHTTGIGGLLGFYISLVNKFQLDSYLLLYFIIFAAGLIGSARLTLNAHTPAQIYAGYVLGCGVIVLFG